MVVDYPLFVFSVSSFFRFFSFCFSSSVAARDILIPPRFRPVITLYIISDRLALIHTSPMDSMDVTFVLVNQSTTGRFAAIAKELISPMIDRLYQANYDARFALIKTDASGGFFPPAIVQPFTTSKVTFNSWLPDSQAPFVRRVPQGTNAVCQSPLLSSFHAVRCSL